MCSFADCKAEIKQPSILCPAHQQVLILRVQMLERQNEILTRQLMAGIPESANNPLAVRKWQEAHGKYGK